MLYPVSETLKATETIHNLWSTWPKESLAVLSASMVLPLVTISLTKMSPKKTSWSAQLNFIFSFTHFPSHPKVVLQICCNGKVTPIHQAMYAPSPKLVCLSIPPARDNRLINKATLYHSWSIRSSLSVGQTDMLDTSHANALPVGKSQGDIRHQRVKKANSFYRQ